MRVLVQQENSTCFMRGQFCADNCIVYESAMHMFQGCKSSIFASWGFTLPLPAKELLNLQNIRRILVAGCIIVVKGGIHP